jgi:hypothetical protein
VEKENNGKKIMRYKGDQKEWRKRVMNILWHYFVSEFVFRREDQPVTVCPVLQSAD